jgi:NAD(P)-dependent dehydrogenase (short-subunit alcohol dehydrogenase family)
MPDLAGRSVLVSGATDGLGRALAAELARRGAAVLLHGRDPERAEVALAELRDLGGEGHAVYLADYSSLAEVRAMWERILAERDALHVLVNNAGIGTTLPGDGERMESNDGYELRFQVNYLAGYLLATMLEPLLARSAPARVVNVASAGQMPIDFDDVMLERDYSGTQAYCQSKLAQVMHAIDLAAAHHPARLTANALHPATYMPTKMVLAARGSAVSTLEEGVEATLRLVVDPDLDGVSGLYYNGLREDAAHPQAYDVDARRRLHDLSERLVGVDAQDRR